MATVTKTGLSKELDQRERTSHDVETVARQRRAFREDHKASKTMCAWWLSKLFVVASAFRYARAAQRDERNGFPYSAAMKWRYAGDLSAPNTPAAEYCWGQWERIMHLPRRLAEPVSDSSSPEMRMI
jgi:hypothetical protein